MRPLLWLLLAVLALAAALLAVGWVLSGMVIVPEPYSLMPEFEVLAVEASEPPGLPVVILPQQPNGNQHADTVAAGVYGLLWEGGHGTLGPVLELAPERESESQLGVGPQAELEQDDAAVGRELTLLGGELPRAGQPARLDPFVYRTDPLVDLGLPFEELTLEGPVGDLRSWFVPSRQTGTAVLLLHGRRRGELAELLRFVQAVNDLGLPSLALAYRNHDASAPSPDGLYHYGASEWEDALVGAAELKRRGYDRVFVFGVSMGGAVALEALKRWSPDLPELVGVILDSPLVDPYAVVQLGAQQAGMPLPALATALGLTVAGWRTGEEFGSLRQARSAPSIQVPVMLVGGTADSTVPIAAVDAFAAAVTAPLTYYRLDGVEHVEAWNRDPERYLDWLRAFVASIDVAA